jgi:hypothetical protein
MRTFNLALVLFMMTSTAMAQSNYMVTLKSDTIRGDLRILSYDQIDRVQIINNGKKEMYKALDILIVSLDHEFYKAVQFDKSIRLMKIIKSGYLSLYGFRVNNQSTFDGRYLVRLDGNNMELPNLGFKKIMANYLEDCADLSEKIKNGDVEKKNIEQIIDQYNECLNKSRPVVTRVPVMDASTTQTEQTDAIKNLILKVSEQDFASRQDALDILKDIENKVARNERVSNYLLDGLQSTLKDQPAVADALAACVALLKK